MMYVKVVSAFLCIIFCTSMQVSAKVRGEANIIAIDSEVLNETRELMVHLPNNYDRYTDTSYPVLFLLDGQRNFAHAAGTLVLLNQSGMASEMIIVAINNTYRTRDFTPTYRKNITSKLLGTVLQQSLHSGK
ncbi:alpha/beta hydrolase-fold protein [Salinimonas iocasae]|nr:alpha/beta hydrolase-fold protein [Salinimonas iocasae]